MPTTTPVRRLAPLCGLALALTAPTLGAQQTVSATVVTAALSEAHDLRDRAEALRTSTVRRNDLKRAAKMHMRAADLLGDREADTYTSLWTAATLYYGAGDNRKAAEVMEHAATQAADRGDVVKAASAYLDASFLASAMSQPERAIRLGRRAESLTSSPLLSEPERATLRARIVTAREVALAR